MLLPTEWVLIHIKTDKNKLYILNSYSGRFHKAHVTDSSGLLHTILVFYFELKELGSQILF